MKDILVVDDLAQLKAMSNSYRIQIIHSFEDKPATAKQISEKTGRTTFKSKLSLENTRKSRNYQISMSEAKIWRS